MNIQRFTAPTSREALAKARAVFGEGTLILSNRPTPTGVEVVATAEDALAALDAAAEQQQPPKKQPQPRAAARTVPARDEAAAAATTPAQDSEQLAMSTLSFQDYVRERMLRRRHDAVTAAQEALVAVRPQAAPVQAAPQAKPTPPAAAEPEVPVVPQLTAQPARAVPKAAPAAAQAAPASILDWPALEVPPLPAIEEQPLPRIEAATAAAAPLIAEPVVAKPVAPAPVVPAPVVPAPVVAAPVAAAPVVAAPVVAAPVIETPVVAAVVPAAPVAVPPAAAAPVVTVPAAVVEAAASAIVQAVAAPVAAAANAASAAASAAAAPTGIVNELQAMKAMIDERFNTLAWLGETRQDPIRANLMLKLIRAGYSPTLSRALLEHLPEGTAPAEAVRWLTATLVRNLRTDNPGQRMLDEGGIFALVGATGVGKTTTIAKLAGLCAREHGVASVGLITLDTFRMGAHEQLRAHARQFGVVAHQAHDRAALQELLNLFENRHMVLVDTTGVAPNDPRMRGMLDMLDLPGLNRVLVLNAGAHGDVLDNVLSSFRGTGTQHAILSKVDEAVKLGPALDTLIRHQFVLRGITNGQRVPEDWDAADAGTLVRQSMRAPARSAFDPRAGDLNLFFSPDAGNAQEEALQA